MGDRRGRIARHALQRAAAVGVACHHIDGVADVGRAQRVGGAGRPRDVAAVALPLVADGAETIDIRQRVRCRQHLVLRRRAADRHRPGRRMIDMGDRRGRIARHALQRAAAVGVACHHIDGVADVGRAQRVGGAGRPRDVAAVALPLVADGAETIDIRQRVRCRQHLVLRRRAADRHRPGRRMIDMGDRRGRIARHALQRAAAVGVACHHIDGVADVGRAQRVGGAGRPRDVAAVALPLVADGAETIDIRQRVRCRQHLVLRRRAADRHRPGRRMIDMGDRRGRIARHALQRAAAVGVACHHIDGVADVGRAQRVGGAGRPRDVAAVALPLVADGAETIDIRQRVRCRQHLVLRRRAADRHRPGRRMIDMGDRRGRIARHALQRAAAVGVACHHIDGVADVGRAQRVGGAGRPRDVAAVALPLVADGAETIDIRQRVRCRQHLVLRRRAADRHRPGRRMIDMGDRRGRIARHALQRAAAVGVACHHIDGVADVGRAQRVGGAGRPRDVAAVALPLVADGAETIDIRQRVRCRQHLVLRRRAADRRRPGRRRIDVGDRRGPDCSPHALQRAAAVGVACHHIDGGGRRRPCPACRWRRSPP